MRSPIGSPSCLPLAIRSLSRGSRSESPKRGPVSSDRDCCSERSGRRGERSTEVLYSGVSAGGWIAQSRARNSPPGIGHLADRELPRDAATNDSDLCMHWTLDLD